MSIVSPADLLLHYQTFLPRITDFFSNNADVSAEIIGGDPQTLRVTDVAHGASTGDQVVLTDGIINNGITAVEQVGEELRFTTSSEHDLMEDYQKEITLSGFTDSSLNGVHTLISVPSKNLFEITYPTLPVLTGSEVLQEKWEYGIDGLFEVTVVDVDTYDISLDGNPIYQVGSIPSLKRASNIMMGIAIDANIAEEQYMANTEASGKLGLYIIMGDCTVGKDPNTVNDSTATMSSQNDLRMLMINTFNVVVFFPTKKQYTGAKASQLAWDTVLKQMLYVGSAIEFDNFGSSPFLAILTDHGTGIYKKAFYSHVYSFEYSYQVTFEDMFTAQFPKTRALRESSTDLGGISGEQDL